MKSIAHIAVQLRNGKSVRQSSDAAGLPITRIETIADGTINPDRVGFADLQEDDCNGWLLEDGDILISHINSTKHLGKCAIYDGDPPSLVHGMNLLGLRVEQDVALPRYVYRMMSSPGFRRQIPRITKNSVNQSSFNISNFKKLEIPLPPLSEQKRIAGILDAADALRAKRRDALAQLDTLLQATFLDMFGDPVTNPMGWQQCDLPEAFWLQEGPGVRNWQFKDSGIKLLNVANILKTNELDLAKTDRHLDPAEVEKKYSHFLADDGDLVIASSGISIDDDGLLRTRAAFVQNHHLPLCMNTSTIRFKAIEGVSHLTFLQQWINSYEFRTQITQEVTGSAQKNFGPTHLKRLKMTLPPLELQVQFAAKVEAIEKQKTIQQDHLAELDTLFASLQQRAFAGAL